MGRKQKKEDYGWPWPLNPDKILTTFGWIKDPTPIVISEKNRNDLNDSKPRIQDTINYHNNAIWTQISILLGIHAGIIGFLILSVQSPFSWDQWWTISLSLIVASSVAISMNIVIFFPMWIFAQRSRKALQELLTELKDPLHPKPSPGEVKLSKRIRCSIHSFWMFIFSSGLLLGGFALNHWYR